MLSWNGGGSFVLYRVFRIFYVYIWFLVCDYGVNENTYEVIFGFFINLNLKSYIILIYEMLYEYCNSYNIGCLFLELWWYLLNCS